MILGEFSTKASLSIFFLVIHWHDWVLRAICKDETRWYDWGLGVLFCDGLLSGSNVNVYFLVITRFLSFHTGFIFQSALVMTRVLRCAFQVGFTKDLLIVSIEI